MQGKTQTAAEKIIEEAKKAEEVGCIAIVLECIPADLAEKITKMIKIPTIGIGAGVNTNGQVLVLQDLLGLSGFKPRFVRQYLNGAELVQGALNNYAKDVLNSNFPGKEETK